MFSIITLAQTPPKILRSIQYLDYVFLHENELRSTIDLTTALYPYLKLLVRTTRRSRVVNVGSGAGTANLKTAVTYVPKNAAMKQLRATGHEYGEYVVAPLVTSKPCTYAFDRMLWLCHYSMVGSFIFFHRRRGLITEDATNPMAIPTHKAVKVTTSNSCHMEFFCELLLRKT